jgi:ABC-2 type transport system ATP-binding protein
MADFAVETQGLRCSFGRHEVLRGVDLAVPPGEVFALLGPNGAGKTTTLAVLTTLVKPDSGTAIVGGYDVVRQARRVRQVITVTGQGVGVDPVLTGLENLILMARLRHRPRPKDVARDLIERFGLEQAASKPVGTYSGGMQRRLDLAMSLIGRPRVAFLDEPTIGLDPAARRDTWRTIEAMAAAGSTVFLTTQHIGEAAHLARLIAVLDQGRIIASGNHEAILTAGHAANLEDAFLALTSGAAVNRP